MGQRRTTMVLNLLIQGVGCAYGAWRLQYVDAASSHNSTYYGDLARTAESGRIHSLFLTDFLHVSPASAYDVQERLDPAIVLASVASTTERIGLIATSSTTYGDPYTTARRFASLDHLSGGRSGWNIVTTLSPSAAANFGQREHPEHDERYAQADEFVQICRDLWDSWDADAIVADRVTRQYLRPDSVRPINHNGKYFSVRGPLNVPRPPQGRPVLAQAGSSPAGIRLAARHADLVFTTQLDQSSSIQFMGSLSQALAREGREPNSIVVLPGVMPIVGKTREAARELVHELAALTTIEEGMPLLQHIFGDLDLSVYDFDAPFPDILPLLPPNAGRSRAEVFVAAAEAEQLTLREVTQRIASTSGHRMIAGTADDIAKDLESWFATGAADGFNLLPPYLPDSFNDFVENVIPRLQDRGIFQREYQGDTLRANLSPGLI
jgi:FMN-dependent oxidoreductase (nitrilotriacetate monooxygenase family)